MVHHLHQLATKKHLRYSIEFDLVFFFRSTDRLTKPSTHPSSPLSPYRIRYIRIKYKFIPKAFPIHWIPLNSSSSSVNSCDTYNNSQYICRHTYFLQGFYLIFISSYNIKASIYQSIWFIVYIFVRLFHVSAMLAIRGDWVSSSCCYVYHKWNTNTI